MAILRFLTSQRFTSRTARLVLPAVFASLLGLVLGSGSLARPSQDSILTNIMCPDSVPVEMTRASNRWTAKLGDKSYPIELLSAALEEEFTRRETTSVFLFLPPGSTYRDVQSIAVECKKAKATCVNWEVRR